MFGPSVSAKYVNGYMKKDGTYVAPHFRTDYSTNTYKPYKEKQYNKYKPYNPTRKKKNNNYKY